MVGILAFGLHGTFDLRLITVVLVESVSSTNVSYQKCRFTLRLWRLCDCTISFCMNDLIVMDLLIENGAVRPVFKLSKGTNCQKRPIASRWEEVMDFPMLLFSYRPHDNAFDQVPVLKKSV